MTRRILIYFSLILIALLAGILNFKYSFKLNHCNDNLFIVQKDLSKLSEALKHSDIRYDELKNILEKQNINFNYDEENNTISFELITVYFDTLGIINSIRY